MPTQAARLLRAVTPVRLSQVMTHPFNKPNNPRQPDALDPSTSNPLNGETTQLPRPRGRPKTKPVVYGPKRKRGRPLKDPNQGNVGTEEPPTKRQRGRPKKAAPTTSVTVQTVTGKFTMPGVPASNGTIPARVQSQPEPATEPCQARVSPRHTEPEASHLCVVMPEMNSPDLEPFSTMMASARGLPVHHALIADEDPERGIEPNETNDEDSEADGAGIGLPDTEYLVNEDDEDDDVGDLGGANPFGEDAPYAGNTPRIRQPLPRWLIDPFEARVNESKQRNNEGLPPLYQQRTFWFPNAAPFFTLRLKPYVSPHELYNPRFFLWDPHALHKIPCPVCNKTLHRHQHIPRPRRCVDMNSTFWIIGYRYRCRHCLNPRTGRRTVTYRSWDPRIMELLPTELAAEFPACLSYRTGMSKSLFEYMRACFQNGLGSKQFADVLRVQHLLAYDNLQLQYLNHLLHCQHNALSSWAGRVFEAFLPFDDTSPQGRHGYTPSSEWLRDMYDSYIEIHRNEFNQHMSMLTGEICAIDHSHKVTKHIARINGEQIFTALLTVTNEKGEIRICNFVATKSHSQFEDALARMCASLKRYGHRQPLLFYTDNMADKHLLEKSFPSLQYNIKPMEKYASLERFELPDDVQILMKDTIHSINDAISTILDDIPVDGGEIIVGFDTEWNVELTPQGFVNTTGNTAIVQVAYQKRVYILQISKMLSRGELPHQLDLFLAHPRIRKAGRHVNSDLMGLQRAYGKPLGSFSGALDLGRLAKDRYIITNMGKTGLMDLMAIVLQKRLDKNTPLRTSQSWENQALTSEQISYAAKDAYASLILSHELIDHYMIPAPLLAISPPSTPVLLYTSNSQSIVAEGQISLQSHLTMYDGVEVSQEHAIIDIDRVLVPGAIIAAHHHRSLESFGQPPFTLVCLRDHARVYSPIAPHTNTHTETGVMPPLGPVNPGTSIPSSSGSLLEEEHFNSYSMAVLGAVAEASSNMISVGESLSSDVSDSAGECLLSGDLDPESVQLAEKKLGPYELFGLLANPMEWDNETHSRVLKDIWHIFHMIYLSATHGHRKQFTRELRDTFFIPDMTDQQQINAWGATQDPPQTYEKLRNSNPEWIRARCRHTIPPPHILYPLVRKVFSIYGPIRDRTTKQRLFSSDTQWTAARNILDLIRKGFISDPPGISLYLQIGIDKKAGGLPIYRCARGTNATEGGVHTHIRSRLPKFGTSVRHIQASLLDFTLRHNLLVGTYNSTGQHYRGHFSIWTTNRIQELLITLRDMFPRPVHLDGWVNGNLYIPTSEVIGILPIPEKIREASGMAPYHSTTHRQQKHWFVASMQNTRKPVLPVHTKTEQHLFRGLMDSDVAFSPRSGEPHWNDAVVVWNQHADQTDGVYYKLVEHLKAYYAKWKTILHIKTDLAFTAKARQPLSRLLHDSHRSSIAPPVPTSALYPHHVESGFTDIDTDSELLTAAPAINRPGAPYEMRYFPDSETIPAVAPLTGARFDSGLHSNRGQQGQIQTMPVLPPTSQLNLFPLTSMSSTPTPSGLNMPRQHAQWQQQIERQSEDRVYARKAQAKVQKPKVQVKRRPRTCRKCGDPECKGRRAVLDCKNPCRDCGQVTCLGRNSHRLDLPCWEGWKKPGQSANQDSE